jgi:hypothetical protein
VQQGTGRKRRQWGQWRERRGFGRWADRDTIQLQPLDGVENEKSKRLRGGLQLDESFLLERVDLGVVLKVVEEVLELPSLVLDIVCRRRGHAVSARADWVGYGRS